MKKNKTNKKNLIILLTLTTLLSIFVFPLAANAYSIDLHTSDQTPKSSQIIPSTVRVAIYDDANITLPSYSGAAILTNNYSNIQTALLAAGHEVTPLTTNQIYNHGLMNARYDVFIMADHLPKTNITNYVKEFWLGGGALLSMDSALNFICYAGILPPESAGDDGNPAYWSYQFSSVQNITTRHPVSRSYAVNDSFTISNSDSSATFSWSALQGTSIASELVKIATRPGLPDAATVVAYDPQSGGGKVVHLPSPRNIEDDAILIDTVEWLCPKPKGRIVFDLSHNPRLGVDNWDDLSGFPGYYEEWRNELVSREYTFDKLYPSSSGNFTSAHLNPYDLLVVVSPDSSISTSEATSVSSWINRGGSLLALGENPTASNFDLADMEINKLLTGRDLILNLSYGDASTDNLTPVLHPTIEDSYIIEMGSKGAINITGDARSLWKFGSNVHIACQDTGDGRIILSNDMNWMADTGIGSQDNRQFSVNIVNWLTSDDAEVLVYVDEPDSPNYYVAPVSNALNELGINFYLTFESDYLNLSLNMYNWELVIIDNPWYIVNLATLTTVNNYVKEGGRLIMSTYNVDGSPTHPLWARLGFSYNQEQPDSSSMYIWDISHDIFNQPVDYGVSRFDPIRDYNDEGDLLTVYPNATALAGYTVSESADNANIVLGNGGKTLFNGYLIDQFTDDFDDSAYKDNFELWINEIAFMWDQIMAETPIDGGIPGYDMYLVLFSVVFSIGVIAIITLRKKRNY